MRLTKVTDTNQQEFYRRVYPMQNESAEELINIGQEKNQVIAIDCCGWY